MICRFSGPPAWGGLGSFWKGGAMAAIRTVDQIARKWATVTPMRTADYEAGVREPRTDWARATLAAADAWKAGVQVAMTQGLFSKGVSKAGTPAWQEGAVSKGTQRWGPGVQLAQDKYQVAFAPFREAIARVVLPPRFARRDPRNLARVSAVVEALVKAKSAALGTVTA